MVAIGLHPTGRLCGMVGWDTDSFGFHADDGTFRAGSGQHQPTSDMMCSSGDIMGCGIDLSEGIVFFTRNGVLQCGFPAPQRSMYAVVTGADRAEVVLNLGQQPFVFQGRVTLSSLSHLGLLRSVGHALLQPKKGVGYADGYAAGWSVDDFVAKSEQSSKLVQAILQVLCVVFASGEHELLQLPECGSVLRASPLVAALDSLLRNDSLTDMAKSSDVYITTCQLLQLLLAGVYTRDIALRLFDHFKRLGALAHTYLQFSTPAERCLSVYAHVCIYLWISVGFFYICLKTKIFHLPF